MTSKHFHRYHLLLLGLPLWLTAAPTIAQSPSPQPSSFPSPLPLFDAEIPALPGSRPTNPNSIKSNISTDALIEQLRTANRGERSRIISMLKERGKSAVPSLTKALSSNDPLLLSGAAEVLGSLGEVANSAVPELLKLLSDNRRALVSSNDDPYGGTLPPLISPEPTLPWGTENQRRVIPNPPDNPRNVVSLYAMGAIGQIGSSARQAATVPLAQLLKSEDAWVRLHAAWSLNQIGAEVASLPTYLALLQHPDSLVQEHTAYAIRNNPLMPKVMGAEATPETAQQLVQLLATSSQVSFAARSLLKIMGYDAIPALTAGLKSSNVSVRFNAAQALGEIGANARSAIPALTALLQDPASNAPPPLPTSLLPNAPIPDPLLSWESYNQPTNRKQLVRIG